MDPAELRERWNQMGKAIPFEKDDFSDVAAVRRKAKERRMELLSKRRFGIPADPNRPRNWDRTNEVEKRKGKRQVNSNFELLEAPPLYSGEVGEVDVSDAVFVHFDGQAIRYRDNIRYLGLFQFWYDCRRKAALQLFTHPGSLEMGGVTSIEGAVLEVTGKFHGLANKAITILNSLRKDVKLKLVKLHKVNVLFRGDWRRYMTFDAIDEWSRETSTYQAAISSRNGLEDVLGLFRDCRNDRTLAIMYLHGAENDLEARERRAREIHEEGLIYFARGKGSEKYEYYD